MLPPTIGVICCKQEMCIKNEHLAENGSEWSVQACTGGVVLRKKVSNEVICNGSVGDCGGVLVFIKKGKMWTSNIGCVFQWR